eukprot:5740157-Pleurochrysis_carterae.AAC.1
MTWSSAISNLEEGVGVRPPAVGGGMIIPVSELTPPPYMGDRTVSRLDRRRQCRLERRLPRTA